jgi:hypothetical protein
VASHNGLRLRWFSLIVLLGGPVGPTCGCARPNLSNEKAVVSPCVLVADPSIYDGKIITLTGFVVSTKEGAYIWDKGCQSSGVVLYMQETVLRDGKFQNLLSQYGLSDSPLRVRLVGVFRYKRFRGVKIFDAQRVLEAYVASGS